jgi:hypothetical protein
VHGAGSIAAADKEYERYTSDLVGVKRFGETKEYGKNREFFLNKTKIINWERDFGTPQKSISS